MLKKIWAAFILLFLLIGCHSGGKKSNSSNSVISMFEGDETWQGMKSFHAIDASGVTKLVVFVRDSSSITIDGKQVNKGDPRIFIKNGVLHISPSDMSNDSLIQSVRIYTPVLERYDVKKCGEANLSGDTLKSNSFVLNVQRCNVFRGNACLAVSKVDVTFHKMLMAKLDLKSTDFSMKADSVQYINLKGVTRSSNISYDQKQKGRVDVSDLKIIK